MKEITVCSKCASENVIPNVPILDRMHNFIRDELTIVIQEDPDALLFKGAHAGSVRAWICGECGYMDMFVDNPQELYSAYEKSKDA